MYVKLVQKFIFISCFLFVFFSCKKNNEIEISKSSQDLKKIFTEFKDTNLINSEISRALKDSTILFVNSEMNDGENVIVTAISVNKDKNFEYGIKFSVLKISDNILIPEYISDTLDGIRDFSSYGEVYIPGVNKKYLFYDSRSAFIGSNGGEVYVYLFDPVNKEIFSLQTIDQPNEKLNVFSKNLIGNDKVILRDWLMKRVAESFSDTNFRNYETIFMKN